MDTTSAFELSYKFHTLKQSLEYQAHGYHAPGNHALKYVAVSFTNTVKMKD